MRWKIVIKREGACSDPMLLNEAYPCATKSSIKPQEMVSVVILDPLFHFAFLKASISVFNWHLTFLISLLLPVSVSVLVSSDLMSNFGFHAFHLWHSFKNG